ncbi:hypothetical protein F2P81_014488 [Scophthalmus maximus]|uniref:Uncharacterized protein n=1 Tax=Scophthalmus maximus TaxID=52904 RepID=A0A6A4SJ37_SCOMX|nr:hypothetical protein F2P81_014488 [Scophthalmus maximus]
MLLLLLLLEESPLILTGLSKTVNIKPTSMRTLKVINTEKHSGTDRVFKPGISSVEDCASVASGISDAESLESDVNLESAFDNGHSENVEKDIEVKLASVLLKLEHIFLVSNAALDELLQELNSLIGYLSLPITKKTISQTAMAGSSPARLKVILGESNIEKLTLPNGIPESFDELLCKVKTTFRLKGNIRLQYMDQDFGNDFFNLNSTSEVQDLGTIKVVNQQTSPPLISAPETTSSHFHSFESEDSVSLASNETIVISSPESVSSRNQQWPMEFQIPRFDTELQLEKGNSEYQNSQKMLNVSSRIKSDILNILGEDIYQYKAYPEGSCRGLNQEAPLFERASFLQWLLQLETAIEVQNGKLQDPAEIAGVSRVVSKFPEIQSYYSAFPAKKVKRPKRAEADFYPSFPVGETLESLEKERLKLLSEVGIRNNERVIADKMAHTFAIRRQEVVNQEPSIKFFQDRWPALFQQNENENIHLRRECVLKTLIVYLGEDPDDLIKEYLDSRAGLAETELEQLTMAVFVIRKEGEGLQEPPEDIGIVIEALKRSFEIEDVDDIPSFSSTSPISTPITPSSSHFFLNHNKATEGQGGDGQSPSLAFNNNNNNLGSSAHHSCISLGSSPSPVLKSRTVVSSLSFNRGTMNKQTIHHNGSSVTRASSFQSRLNPNSYSMLSGPSSDNDSLHSSTSSLEYSGGGGGALPLSKLGSYPNPPSQVEYHRTQPKLPQQHLGGDANLIINHRLKKFSSHGSVFPTEMDKGPGMMLGVPQPLGVNHGSMPSLDLQIRDGGGGIVGMQRGGGRVSPGLRYANVTWNGHLHNDTSFGVEGNCGSKNPCQQQSPTVPKAPQPKVKEIPRLNKFPLDLDNLIIIPSSYLTTHLLHLTKPYLSRLSFSTPCFIGFAFLHLFTSVLRPCMTANQP